MRNYLGRLHLVGIATLALLTVGLALFGWSLRPAAGAFSPVPGNLALSVPEAPGGLLFAEQMTSSDGGGAVLTVSAQGLPDVPQQGNWLLVVDNPGAAQLCTPRALTRDQGATAVQLAPQHVVRHVHTPDLTTGKHTRIGIAGSGTFFVRLCWPSRGPVSTNGAYASARFPALIMFTPHESQNVRLELSLGSDTNPADYTIQSIQQPTGPLETGWYWTKAPVSGSTGLDGGLPAPLAFAAVDTSETQHDTYQAFLSGILFGVAGGALIALIQELVAPFRSRQELRPPEPGG